MKEVLRFIKQANQEVNKSMGNKQDFSAEKHSLKDKLMAIILLETSKPYKEMDSDLVTECVDFLMELEEKQRLTKAEIKKKVDEIPFHGKITAIGSHVKKKIRTKRIIVIAAVLAILLAIFSILVVSFTNTEDSLIDRFARYIVGDMNPGEQIEIGNIELIKPNETKTFSSAEELVRYENIAILFPTWMPNDNKITECCYYSDDSCGKYYILDSQDPECCIIIYTEMTIPEEAKASNTSKSVGEHTVYIISDNSYAQGDFEYHGYYYSVNAHTEEDVLKIIENLKEIR